MKNFSLKAECSDKKSTCKKLFCYVFLKFLPHNEIKKFIFKLTSFFLLKVHNFMIDMSFLFSQLSSEQNGGVALLDLTAEVLDKALNDFYLFGEH